MPHPVEALLPLLLRVQGRFPLLSSVGLETSTQLTLQTLRAAPILYSPEARRLIKQSALVARRAIALLASPEGREACHALLVALSRALAVVGTEEATATAQALQALAVSASDATAALARERAAPPRGALLPSGVQVAPPDRLLEVYAEGGEGALGALPLHAGATLEVVRGMVAAELLLECDQLLLLKGGPIRRCTPIHPAQESHPASRFFRSDGDALALRNPRPVDSRPASPVYY